MAELLGKLRADLAENAQKLQIANEQIDSKNEIIKSLNEDYDSMEKECENKTDEILLLETTLGGFVNRIETFHKMTSIINTTMTDEIVVQEYY